MASVTNTLSIAFTLLLFVFFIISMYEKVNIEVFQQYKGVIFAGSAIAFLSILGLPYMEYDVASQSPSFQLFPTAIGILAMFGAIFVYLLNMPFDTYIMWISTAVVVITVYSRISKSAESTDFPPFARDLLIMMLVAGVIMGIRILGERWQPNNPSLQDLLNFVVNLTPIALWGMLAYAIYRAISGLAEYRASKTCSLRSKRKTSVVPFEGYQNPTAPTSSPPPLNQRMQTAINRLQDNIDLLMDMTDSTCSIIRDVEQGYIGARSAPADESELSLPKEEQDRRRKERQTRAEKSFKELRKVYASGRNVPILECFQDEIDASEEDVTLRELCVQLHGLLENAETLAQIRKIQSMEVELAFADRLIQKSEGFQDAPSTTLSPTFAQLYNGVSGTALRAAATTLLQRELKLQNDIKQIQNTIMLIQKKLNTVNKKATMVANGDYNANSEQNAKSAERLGSITTRIGE